MAGILGEIMWYKQVKEYDFQWQAKKSNPKVALIFNMNFR